MRVKKCQIKEGRKIEMEYDQIRKWTLIMLQNEDMLGIV